MKINKNLLFSINLSLMLLVSCGKKIEDTKRPVGSTEVNPVEKVETEDFNKEQRENIFNAIKANSPVMLRPLLEESEHIDYLFENGESPLTLAIKINSTDVYTELIRKTINFNLKNSKGNAPLHLAIKTNHLFLVNLLLSKDIDVNLRNEAGLTPIILSLGETSEYIAIKLITNGANIQEYNEYGLSVKQLSRSLRLRKLFELISFVEEHDVIHEKHLKTAIKTGNTNTVDYLLNTHEEYQELISKTNVLIIAINIKDKKLRMNMLKKLLSRGADPSNSQGGVTPLIHAVRSNQYSSVAKLLAYGADISYTDLNGMTAANYAMKAYYFEILNLINRSNRN
jgi:ankyrin repeat protein